MDQFWNAYSYCGGDPVNFVDEWGLADKTPSEPIYFDPAYVNGDGYTKPEDFNPITDGPGGNPYTALNNEYSENQDFNSSSFEQYRDVPSSVIGRTETSPSFALGDNSLKRVDNEKIESFLLSGKQKQSIDLAFTLGTFFLPPAKVAQYATKIDKGVDLAKLMVAFLKGLCFADTTLVYTNNGYKQIKDISIGDSVLTYNFEKKIFEFQPVIDKYITENQPVLELIIEGNGLQKEVAIRATPNHPFYLKNIGWTEAQKLNAGDTIQCANGLYAVVKLNSGIVEYTTVYNLNVAENHNFFVSVENVLVHNNCMANAANAAKSTLNLLRAAERTAGGGLKVAGSTLQQIGRAEARGGSAFSGLKTEVVQSKPATWGGKLTGGTQTVVKYIDPATGQTKFVVHSVTDAAGKVVHRDFDAVQILSGQTVVK